MKIKILTSENKKINLWLPLSLLKSNFIRNFLIKNTSGKTIGAKIKNSLQSSSNANDVEDMTTTAVNTCINGEGENFHSETDEYDCRVTKDTVNIKVKDAIDVASNYDDSSLSEIFDRKTMIKLYKELKKWKGLEIVNIKCNDGTIVKITI